MKNVLTERGTSSIKHFESKNYSIKSKYVNTLSVDESNVFLSLFSKQTFSVLFCNFLEDKIAKLKNKDLKAKCSRLAMFKV